MANGNVTITNGKTTKSMAESAYKLLQKNGIVKVRNEDWWLDGNEKPEPVSVQRPGKKTVEKKEVQKPTNGFEPLELRNLRAEKELREKIKDLETEIETLKAENLQLKTIQAQAKEPVKDPSKEAKEPDAVGSGAAGGNSTTTPSTPEANLGPDGQPIKSEKPKGKNS